jgi:hypothetical protein
MFELLMKEKEGKEPAASSATSAGHAAQDFRDDRE